MSNFCKAELTFILPDLLFFSFLFFSETLALFADMVGLEDLKDIVIKMFSTWEKNKYLPKAAQVQESSHNYILVGNPGTGKWSEKG